jgi:hypothetical protein
MFSIWVNALPRMTEKKLKQNQYTHTHTHTHTHTQLEKKKNDSKEGLDGKVVMISNYQSMSPAMAQAMRSFLTLGSLQHFSRGSFFSMYFIECPYKRPGTEIKV